MTVSLENTHNKFTQEIKGLPSNFFVLKLTATSVYFLLKQEY